MKFSEHWLRSWVNPDMDTDALSVQLTMLGLEVEEVLPVAADFTKVVIGEVLSTEQHPDADRLKVCQVRIAEGADPLNIVCGGKNVRPGLKVPVIQVGATLGDMNIKKAKLRGVESFGMICSEVELGVADSSDGIMELPQDAPIGTDIRDYLNLDDHCFDIGLTPNRGDCASLIGIARDLAASQQLPLNIPTIKTHKPTIQDELTIKITAVTACPRYVGRVIKNIKTGVASPLWLQEKLRRSGLRSIHPVVDISNLVMLEYGQPMHAFDLDKLSGDIQVRMAKRGETLTLLDEQSITLDDRSLVIADDKSALALAGVMGGFDSAVTDTTTHLFLESAYFEAIGIRKTARRYGLTSDSSYRFERGVDYKGQERAIERMTELLMDIVGAEVEPLATLSPKIGPMTIVSADEHLPQTKAILLRAARIEKILGFSLTDTQVQDYLLALKMEISPNANGWEVTPPSYRFDIELEIDVIEELARMYGYQNIQAKPLHFDVTCIPDSEQQLPAGRVLHYWADQGYTEIRSYSFVDPAIEKLLAPNQQAKVLVNPISSEMSVMQTTLWTGLLTTLQYNLARQQESAKMFEVAMVFEQQGKELIQTKKIAGLLFGSQYPEQWAQNTRNVDFFDLKGDVSTFLALTGVKQFVFQAAEHPALHPGQTAQIGYAEQAIGWCGKLHPKIQAALDLRGDVFLFELDYSNIINKITPEYKAISKFPGARRDLALVVDKTLPVQQLIDAISNAGTNLLQRVEIFDIYEGQGIEAGKKSVAISLNFQLNERTLTDMEVNELLANITSTLQQQCDAVLRG